MANITTIKSAVMLSREAKRHGIKITPFIWGERGLGKSSLVKQLCVENDMGCIDLRCSQLEASDIRGLPDQGPDGRTHYLPPADMPTGDMTLDAIKTDLGPIPTKDSGESEEEYLEATRIYEQKLKRAQCHFQKGILFIDEVNRAQDDVLQAVFQLVLDHAVGDYVLPPGWSVVAAGNFQEGSYVVSGFNDAAFLDRFAHMTLSGGDTTIEEWVNYMSGVHGGAAADVIEFASQNAKHLDGDITPGELGFKIDPSRRSWESVVAVQQAYIESNDPNKENSYRLILSGLIGQELANTFSTYACPVKPRDILKNGVGPYKNKLKKLKRTELQGLMWGLISFCKDRADQEEIANICLDFAEHMAINANDNDIVVAFCRALVSGGGQDKAQTAVISNPALAKMVGDYNEKNGLEPTFIDYLNKRETLQNIIAKLAWGSE